MGLTTGNFPPVDPATFTDLPYRERIKVLSRHWAEYGFGSPKITTFIYLGKLAVIWAALGFTIATLTSGHSPLEPGQWWDEPIVYQKMVVWTMLLETLGLAGSWGPLAGHFKPMTGGYQYFARLGTLRNPPWPDKVPGTHGDERSGIDTGIYVSLVLALLVALALPGVDDDSLTGIVGDNEGLMHAAPALTVVALAVALGLRDKIAFLATRGEQYLPLLVFFAAFPFVDMIIAAKLLIVTVWVGAAFSKIGHHFGNVIPPMVSNTPWLASRRVKRMHYRNFPEDLRPSKNAVRLAHGPGSFVEFVTPFVLLFSTNDTLTLCAVILMISFHVFITSTFPLAVPLEWNTLFMFVTAFLFLGFPANEGFAVGDMDTALLCVTLVAVSFFPILGNNRPDLVSFLPSMRQYAGNWATGMWAFAPGRELVLDEKLTKPALMQRQQLVPLYGEEAAEVIMHQLLGFRAMHSQGRALNSIMMRTLGDDIDRYTLREAEFSCNAVTGFNFGDGHMHDHRLIAAMQRRCNFAPGEFVVVWVESEAVFRGYQKYWVMDAAIGIVERGRVKVEDCINEQPWLPNGPIPVEVEWRLDGYERVSHGAGPLGGVGPVEAVGPRLSDDAAGAARPTLA